MGHAEIFEAQRPQLRAIAYQLLGTLTDVDDVLQDAWLAWDRADHSRVREPRAYLATVTTNTALRRIATKRREREAYPGVWLPEPVVTADEPSARAELVDEVSYALLHLLQSLTPLERAVFVLHESFAFPLVGVATMLDRSPVAVRQLAHRARARVRDRHVRNPVDAGTHRAVTDRFLRASRTGSVDELMALLAPDVAMWTDGGGTVPAARFGIRGARRTAALFAGLARLQRIPGFDAEPVIVNGRPGALLTGDLPTSVVVLDVVAADRPVYSVFAQVNPAKLGRLPGVGAAH